VPRNDDVSSDEATSWRDETAQDRHRDRKRWVRHHSKWPLGQSQVAGIGSHDFHVEVDEPIPQRTHSVWVEFDCDDSSSVLDERPGERAFSRTDIDYEVAWLYASVEHHCSAQRLPC
jgi:hypothetical protein